MANKQLTATVRLNTTQAEQKLKNISKAIDNINRAANKQSNAYNQVNSALGKTVSTANKVKSKTDETTQGTKKWSNALSGVNSKLNTSSKTLGMIGGKLRQLADTYLGVMGMGAIINTSDMITSAENKLNYIHGGDATLTQDAMDKMYASSQKVRMGYGDMMSNVSKSMALAGDAFDNCTDKAIRFQEIMAEAYAVGGASAQEMSSSMYQLIQALGSGTLAGDELRSVREGAPLAYKAIEEFAQGVYNCEDSLKDMASQGLITADMVTAAILQSGEALDEAFGKTEQTFAQTWEQIKNTAIYAFKPISKMLRTALNDAIDNGLLQKVEAIFSNIAKGIMIVLRVIGNTIKWIANNWNWLQHILIGGLILYASYLIMVTAVAVANAVARIASWIAEYGWILLVIACVLGLIYIFYLFKTGAVDACEAVALALLLVATVVMLIGILTLDVAAIVTAAIVAVIAAIVLFFAEICYGVAWSAGWISNIVIFIVNFIAACLGVLLALFYNLIALLVNLIMGCGKSIVAISHNVVAAVINVAMGLWNSISAIAQNIGIAFQNAWIWAKNTFWEFVADVLKGVSKLEPVINGIASLIGAEGVDFSSAIANAESKQESYVPFVSVSDAWNEGLDTFEYKDISDAWSSGWDTLDFANLGDVWNEGFSLFDYVDPHAWGETAYDWGSGLKDWINEALSGFQGDGGFSLGDFLNGLGEKLGLDFSNLGSFPTDGLGNFDPGSDFGADDLDKALGGIGDDTSKIANSMDLTSDDVAYLRKIADMEWKKEFTTAEIKVDMTNYNTVNNESDMEGIVTKLVSTLYEELNEVSDGVYAY